MSSALKFANCRNTIFIIIFSFLFGIFGYSHVYAGGEGSGDGGGGVGVGGTFSPDRGWGSDPSSPSTGTGTVSDGKGNPVDTMSDVYGDIATKGTPYGRGTIGQLSHGTGFGISDTYGGDTEAVTNSILTPTPPTSCTNAADIVVTDMSFALKSSPKEYLLTEGLDIGQNYIPAVVIANVGCTDTDAGEAGTNFRNQAPRGESGTFPVRLQIDFDKDGDIDYDETVNAVGPLDAGEVQIVVFPSFLSDIEGAHEAVASADPHSMPKVGCSGGWGCIKETKETNKFVLNFSITKPWVDLGSFLYADWQTCNRTDPGDASLIECQNWRQAQLPVKRGLYRDVEEKVYKSPDDLNYEIGLLWDGYKVIFNTCTGNRSDFDGRWHPWALTDGINKSGSRANASFSKNHYDTDIDEPPRLKTHTYVITCKTTGGGTVSDTHILNGGADLSGAIDLSPTAKNKVVAAGELLENYRFWVKNEGIVDVNKFTYSISINGSDVTQGDGSVTTALKVEDSQRYNGALTWRAPDTDTKVPIEVCITHPDMDGKRCDTAKITVATDTTYVPECRDGNNNDPEEDNDIDDEDNGCWTDPTDSSTYDPEDDDESYVDTSKKPECNDSEDNDGDGTTDYPADAGCTSDDDDDESEDPTISAYPTIVRYGDTSTVKWDPRDNGSCSLSKNIDTSSSPNSPGSATVTITAETIFTITCTDDEGATREASVTVQALPLLYET